MPKSTPAKKSRSTDDDAELIENMDLLNNIEMLDNENDWRMLTDLEKWEKSRGSQTADEPQENEIPENDVK